MDNFFCLQTAELYVYSFDNDTIGEVKQTVSDLSSEVIVIEYSPDGAFLAVGEGRKVSVFRTSDYKVIMKTSYV